MSLPPIPASLALELSAHAQAGHSGETLLTDDDGAQVGPWKLERAIRKARGKVQDLPTGFRFHDLRYCLASLLIASGADVKVVQARLRHASAKTLDTYGHLWPDFRRVDTGRRRCGARCSDGTEAEPDWHRAMNMQVTAR
ncbi:tyrosine-type recombinase/integrase [Sphaerisporangium perillae]|uniref:tyrosine-type recombinase/integrase n=1 Tax=Sphaerisporangium perillae TaxID=2935860 RepID=UPI00200F0A03|nr:tyrosine-type recombinase/integrase [Sphaerisporangium perillae]